ncbi:MAG: hypothetical protein RLP09_05675 [Sandaracinaceae bacterium]
MRTQRVKGSLMAARPRYVRETWGEDTLRRVAEATAPVARRHLEDEPVTMAWFPLEEMVEIDQRIIEVAMDGDLRQMQPFGATIASYDLPTIYRALYRLGTPAFVLKSIGVAYRQYLRPGWARTEVHEKGRATVTIGEAIYPRYLCKYGIAGWVESAITLSGGEDVRVAHVECLHEGDERCRWEGRWR